MWRSKEGRMDLRRSRWILGVVLACFAILCTPAGADEPNFTEEQKIDFLQHAKVIISKPEKKGKSNALHLTLSDGKVTHDACFPPIDERKAHAPAPSPGGETDLTLGIIGDIPILKEARAEYARSQVSCIFVMIVE